MTSTSKVATAVAAAPAPSGPVKNTRAPALGQEHPVEHTSVAAYVARFDTQMDFSSGGGGSRSRQGDQQRGDPYATFLNSVGKFSIGYLANREPEPETEDEGPGSFSVFLSDAMHGIGVYEGNMRVLAGTFRVSGQTLDRLY